MGSDLEKAGEGFLEGLVLKLCVGYGNVQFGKIYRAIYSYEWYSFLYVCYILIKSSRYVKCYHCRPSFAAGRS